MGLSHTYLQEVPRGRMFGLEGFGLTKSSERNPSLVPDLGTVWLWERLPETPFPRL